MSNLDLRGIRPIGLAVEISSHYLLVHVRNLYCSKVSCRYHSQGKHPGLHNRYPEIVHVISLYCSVYSHLTSTIFGAVSYRCLLPYPIAIGSGNIPIKLFIVQECIPRENQARENIGGLQEPNRKNQWEI
ncbi:hypothetical protein AVEN_131804-1 [Araneus ventricosus]|uniref:Uncharacterized protein n=1 Tax=Araneus ventricosus TaxID=182803 RepID=A0A4Y2VP01_ARAVE|nr:hypothetical protein AVEN_131804-1 [Araneus ventricosus]